jgi:hypothetical protein
MRVLLDNPRVRITDLRLAPGASVRAEHPFPTVRWQVGSSTHCIGGAPAITAEDKAVQFVEASAAWDLAVPADEHRPWRQVLFEIKQKPRFTPAEAAARLASAIYPTNVGTSLLLENDLVRVWDFCLEPGEGPTAPHHHVLDYCFVYVAAGRLLGYHHDGAPGLFDAVNDDGDATWVELKDDAPSDPAEAHGGKNGYDDRPMREYLVELK